MEIKEYCIAITNKCNGCTLADFCPHCHDHVCSCCTSYYEVLHSPDLVEDFAKEHYHSVHASHVIYVKED